MSACKFTKAIYLSLLITLRSLIIVFEAQLYSYILGCVYIAYNYVSHSSNLHPWKSYIQVIIIIIFSLTKGGCISIISDSISSSYV